jgi:heme exporter protein D
MENSASKAYAQAIIWPFASCLLVIGLVCLGLKAHTAPTETSWPALILGFFIWVGGAALCALVLKGLSLAHDFWLALGAMWRPLALAVLGAFLLFFNDQGRELGVSLMIDGAGWFHLVFLFAMLFLALLYWSFNNWNSARLGVGAALDKGVLGVVPLHPLLEKPDARVIGENERWLFWLPRTLGVCAHFFAAINLSLAAWSQPDFVRESLLIRLLAWTAPLAIAVFTGLVYIFDRYALSKRTAGEESGAKWAAARVGSLTGAGLLLLAIAILAFVNFHSDSGVWARFLWGTFTLSLSAFAFLIIVSFLRRGDVLGVNASEDDRRRDNLIEATSLAHWTFWLFVPTVVVVVLVWFWAPFVGQAVGSMVVAYFALGAVLATINAFELAIAKLVKLGWFGEGANPRAVGAYSVAALIALGLLNAWLHPFHRVRLCDGADCAAPTSAAAYIHEPDRRPSVEDAAKAWYEQAKAAFLKAHGGRMAENERVPMVVVATAGGGIRAAYWTARVLEKLKEDLGSNGLRPYLFAISGVSGGSVGAMAFDAALAKADESPCETCTPATDFLTEDFLAPTLAAGIFKDLPASFLPDLWQDDRGAALEQGFEHASNGQLTRPFLSLFPYGGDSAQASWRPMLLLNATHEESGKRIITSHVLVERNVFVDALDALHVLDGDVRASTAAHNSARFSYISPAGNLGRRKDSATDSKGWPTDWESLKAAWNAWVAEWNGSVIDGGYFENYGALSALELARAAEAALNKENAHFKLVILMISSDPGLQNGHTLVRIDEPKDGKECLVTTTEREHQTPAQSPNYLSVEPGQVANAWFNELAAPLQGVEAAREAHGNRAAAELAVEVCTEFSQPPQPTAGTTAQPTSQTMAADTAGRGKTADVADAKAVISKPDKPYFAHLAMCTSDGQKEAPIQPPLGWVLSAATQKGLDDLVNRCGNREQLTQLESALGGPAQRQASVASPVN